MSTDAPYFSADKALLAMGNTSRRWQSHLELGKIHTPQGAVPVMSEGPGRGKLRKLSLSAIVQGRIAFALVDCGVDVREAYRAGGRFVYEAGISEPSRAAGRLFPAGETFLIYAVAGPAAAEDRMSVVTDADPAFIGCGTGDHLTAVLSTAKGDLSAPRIIVNLTQLCAKIADALGIDFTAAFIAEGN